MGPPRAGHRPPAKVSHQPCKATGKWEWGGESRRFPGDISGYLFVGRQMTCLLRIWPYQREYDLFAYNPTLSWDTGPPLRVGTQGITQSWFSGRPPPGGQSSALWAHASYLPLNLQPGVVACLPIPYGVPAYLYHCRTVHVISSRMAVSHHPRYLT